MKTFRFSFKGRDRYINANDIFEAMVEFHALYSENVSNINELLITEIGKDEI